jgi:hypothetical protein
MTKHPHFAQKPAGQHKCVKKNPVTKHPHFAEQAAGSQMGLKIMRQNVHISLKSWLDVTNVLKNPLTKHPHFAERPARHHKWVQKSYDKPQNFSSRKGGNDVTEHF